MWRQKTAVGASHGTPLTLERCAEGGVAWPEGRSPNPVPPLGGRTCREKPPLLHGDVKCKHIHVVLHSKLPDEDDVIATPHSRQACTLIASIHHPGVHAFCNCGPFQCDRVKYPHIELICTRAHTGKQDVPLPLYQPGEINSYRRQVKPSPLTIIQPRAHKHVRPRCVQAIQSISTPQYGNQLTVPNFAYNCPHTSIWAVSFQQREMIASMITRMWNWADHMKP